MNLIRTIAIVSTATTFGLLGCGQMDEADVEASEGALTTNYWQNWSSGTAPNCTQGSGGNYSCSWTSAAKNFVSGKGWKPGSRQNDWLQRRRICAERQRLSVPLWVDEEPAH